MKKGGDYCTYANSDMEAKRTKICRHIEGETEFFKFKDGISNERKEDGVNNIGKLD